MSQQQDLFGNVSGARGAYGEPLAARSDPETSHEAARRHAESGRLGTHAAIALSLVKRYPGRTYAELWEAATAN